VLGFLPGAPFLARGVPAVEVRDFRVLPAAGPAGKAGRAVSAVELARQFLPPGAGRDGPAKKGGRIGAAFNQVLTNDT